MGVWSDLPTELMLHALRHIDNTQDLSHLSLVSRRVHILVEPLLYRDVSLDSNAKFVDAYDRYHGEDLFRFLRQFTRTIVTRPALGTHVKTLSLSSVWDVVDDYDAMEDCRRCDIAVDLIEEGKEDEALAEVTDVMEQSGMDPELLAAIRVDLAIIANTAGRRGLRNGLVFKGGCRGVAIILLHHLPKLKVLSLDGPSSLTTIALSCFGFMKGGIPVGLCSIEELTMLRAHSEAPLETEAIVPFMALPKLKTFNITGLRGIDHGPDGHPSVRVGSALEAGDLGTDVHAVAEHVPDTFGENDSRPLPTAHGWIMLPECSCITVLRMTDSAISPSLLERLLPLPLHLEECEYRFSSQIAVEEDDIFLLPVAIARGLRAQASTLRKLTVGVDDRDLAFGLSEDEDEDLNPRDQTFGSLSFLVHLEELNAHLEWLIPPSQIASSGSHNQSDDQNYHHGFVRRNPLDSLLPVSLKTLRLVADPHPSSLLATGLPFTLEKTRQACPALAVLHVLGDGPLEAHSWEDEGLYAETIRLAEHEFGIMVLDDFDFRLFDLTR